MSYFDPATEWSAGMPAADADAVAHVDGACGPRNPGGTGGWGFVLRARDGVNLGEGFGRLPPGPDMTNNVAEYVAAIRAVERYRSLGRKGPLLVRADSQLVVKQMRGEWAVKAGAYVAAQRELANLVSVCPFKIQWEWVPRERNTEADALSKRGLKA